MNDSHEITYLATLIADFPPPQLLPVTDALKQLQFRYDYLLDQATYPLAKLPSFNQFPCQLHHFLYQNILSNAGEYRRYEEPGKGIVYFGSGQKFKGSSPP